MKQRIADFKNGNNLITLFRRETPEQGVGIVAGMATLAGITNALILALINAGTAAVGEESSTSQFFMLFIVAVMLFIVSKKFIMARSICLAEDIIHNIRVRLADKVRRSELLQIERIGKNEIYTHITTETQTISQAAPFIIDACQSAILILFTAIYICYLSTMAFFVTLGLVFSGVVYYLGEKKTIVAALQKYSEKEVALFDSLTNILDGFREIKVNRRKSDDVFETLKSVAKDTRLLKIESGMAFVNNFIFSQAFFYILIGANVFLLPKFSTTYAADVAKITAAILFIIGPLSGLVSSLQVFAMANVAVSNLYRLEDALGAPPLTPAPEGPPAFEEIRIEDLEFTYHGEEAFHVGPANFSIRRGETVFIVGGNGSGKSTFLKLLTGLYFPQAGQITLDGEEVTSKNIGSFRDLYSVIFTEYHLFDRIYGIPAIDENRVRELLKLMELDKKTEFRDGRFTTQDLSGGQKKRLALIVALLEDKPVYVLDEWAADQDPLFRKFFYEEILKEMKARGKTVIAVTHDDKYFAAADHVIKLEYGQIVKMNGA